MIRTILIILILLINLILFSIEMDWGFSYKNYNALLKPPDITGDIPIKNNPYGITINDIGGGFSLIKKFFEFNFYYYTNFNIESSSQISNGIFINASNTSYRIKDIKKDITDIFFDTTSGITINNDLNVLNCVFYSDFADITIGRQIIGWGSGRFMNPTDIILPLNTLNRLQDMRQGVDAIRVEIYPGDMDIIDMGFIAGRDLDIAKSAYYLRFEGIYNGYKIMPLLMNFYQHNLIGFDINGSLFNTAIWFEGAYILNEYFRGTIGIEYVFKNSNYIEFEYMYNGAGTTNDFLYYDNTVNNFAYSEGRVYLLGKHYVDCIYSFAINPLLNISLSDILNLTDYSIYGGINIDYNLSDDIDFFLSIYSGIGENAQTMVIPNEVLPEIQIPQEFGYYPFSVVLGISSYIGK